MGLNKLLSDWLKATVVDDGYREPEEFEVTSGIMQVRAGLEGFSLKSSLDSTDSLIVRTIGVGDDFVFNVLLHHRDKEIDRILFRYERMFTRITVYDEEGGIDRSCIGTERQDRYFSRLFNILDDDFLAKKMQKAGRLRLTGKTEADHASAIAYVRSAIVDNAGILTGHYVHVMTKIFAGRLENYLRSQGMDITVPASNLEEQFKDHESERYHRLMIANAGLDIHKRSSVTPPPRPIRNT